MAQASYGTITVTDMTDITGDYIEEALQSKLKYIWINLVDSSTYPAGTYAASGRELESPSVAFDYTDSNTYGFNSFLSNSALKFRYNSIDLTTIGVDGLKMYAPIIQDNKITGSNLNAIFNTSGINFYNIDDSVNPALSINTNGIQIGKTAAPHMNLTSGGINFYDANGTNSNLSITSNNIRIGKTTSDSLTIGPGNLTFKNNQNINNFYVNITSDSEINPNIQRVKAQIYPDAKNMGASYPTITVGNANYPTVCHARLDLIPKNNSTIKVNMYVGSNAFNFNFTYGTPDTKYAQINSSNQCRIYYDGGRLLGFTALTQSYFCTIRSVTYVPDTTSNIEMGIRNVFRTRLHYDEVVNNIGYYTNDVLVYDNLIIGNYTADRPMDDKIIINGRPLFCNEVLWSGVESGDASLLGLWPNAGSILQLSGHITSQPHGVVIVWSNADAEQARKIFSFQFIPKWIITREDEWDDPNGNGSTVWHQIPASTDFARSTMVWCYKYLQIFDNRILGHAVNSQTGTGYNNKYMVLTAVLGV